MTSTYQHLVALQAEINHIDHSRVPLMSAYPEDLRPDMLPDLGGAPDGDEDHADDDEHGTDDEIDGLETSPLVDASTTKTTPSMEQNTPVLTVDMAPTLPSSNLQGLATSPLVEASTTETTGPIEQNATTLTVDMVPRTQSLSKTRDSSKPPHFVEKKDQEMKKVAKKIKESNIDYSLH